MDALDCLMSRRSIRRYTGEPVAQEHIDAILAAAMAAPSAGNQQPWRFVVLTDREALNDAATTTPYGKMLHEAAFAIVVLGDTTDLKHPAMWEQDCGAATQNALLAAHALGLGGVWLGFWPKLERVDPLKKVLGTPEGIEPFAVLAFGHPAEEKPRSDRYTAEFVHHERW